MRDITSFVTWFVNAFLSLFQSIYNLMESIQFYGVTLFDFVISIFLAGAVIPLLISVARNGSNSVGRAVRSAKNGD